MIAVGVKGTVRGPTEMQDSSPEQLLFADLTQILPEVVVVHLTTTVDVP